MRAIERAGDQKEVEQGQTMLHMEQGPVHIQWSRKMKIIGGG